MCTCAHVCVCVCARVLPGYYSRNYCTKEFMELLNAIDFYINNRCMELSPVISTTGLLLQSKTNNAFTGLERQLRIQKI